MKKDHIRIINYELSTRTKSCKYMKENDMSTIFFLKIIEDKVLIPMYM